MQRLRLFAGYMSLRGGKKADTSKIKLLFTRALPENLSETAEIVKSARQAGAMSTRAMVEMLHKNADWDEEMLARETEQALCERKDA